MKIRIFYKSAQGILLVIFQWFVILQCVAYQGDIKKNNKVQKQLEKVEKEESELESLRLSAEALLRTIKNADIRGFLEFLYEEGDIAIDVDTYMTKSQIADDLLHKGEIYCFIFDESQCQKKRIRSLKTLFSNVREVKIKVSIVPNNGNKYSLAVVEYIWEGKPSPPEFFDPWFILTPKGWKLVNLFAAF